MNQRHQHCLSCRVILNQCRIIRELTQQLQQHVYRDLISLRTDLPPVYIDENGKKTKYKYEDGHFA